MTQVDTPVGYQYPRKAHLRPADIVRLRDNTAWLALKPERDTEGVSRQRYVNLGAGTLWQITASLYPLLADTPDRSVAALHHAGGVQYLDAEEARDLIDCLDAIAAR